MTDDEDDAGEMWWDWSDAAMWIAADADRPRRRTLGLPRPRVPQPLLPARRHQGALMGSTPRAHIAYGYDLGTLEDFRAAEAYDGYPNLPWYNNEGDEDFGSAIKRILLAAAGFTDVWTASDDTYFERKRTAEKRMGVELAYSGGEEPGYILAAKGSKQVTAWTGTMTLDPFVLERTPIDEGWDDKLAAALTALGITPTQSGPAWLVFPSYG